MITIRTFLCNWGLQKQFGFDSKSIVTRILDWGLPVMSYIACLYDSVWLVTSHGHSGADNHFRCVDLAPPVLMDNDNDNHLFLHLSPESRILSGQAEMTKEFNEGRGYLMKPFLTR